jgi:hypothetical protein
MGTAEVTPSAPMPRYSEYSEYVLENVLELDVLQSARRGCGGAPSSVCEVRVRGLPRVRSAEQAGNAPVWRDATLSHIFRVLILL